MTLTSVDLDPELLRQARELTGAKSNRAVIILALRRLTASAQKEMMVEGIAALGADDAEPDAPVSAIRNAPAQDTPVQEPRAQDTAAL